MSENTLLLLKIRPGGATIESGNAQMFNVYLKVRHMSDD